MCIDCIIDSPIFNKEVSYQVCLKIIFNMQVLFMSITPDMRSNKICINLKSELTLENKQISACNTDKSFKQNRMVMHASIKSVLLCDQDRQEDELIRQNIYSSRWNLIFHGIPESEDESCSDLIKHAMVSKLKMDQKKVKATMFCGTHRLGRKKRSSNNNKPGPIIVRFTCRANRDSTWRQRYNLKGSSTRMAEDVPQNVREIRRNVLVPALKNARKSEGTKATIIGDRLLVNGKRYSFDKIPKKWQDVSSDDEMHSASHVEEPEQAQASQAND